MFNKKTNPSKKALSPIQCAICGKISYKVNSFFCGSGHAVCKECQISEYAPIKKNAGGDNKSIAKVLNWDGIDSKNNLASGDHEIGNKAQKKNKKLSKNKVVTENNSHESLSTIHENKTPAPYIETTIEYKNRKYSESKTIQSNSSSIKTSSSGTVHTTDKTSNFDIKSCPRPVTCPHQNCARIITMDSAMQHFMFDHSKLPRIQLACNTPQQFLLESTKLSMNTQCLALMTIQKTKVYFPPIVVTTPIKEDSHQDVEVLLLLMGVRMRLEDLAVGSNTSTQKSFNGSTQSEFTYKDSFIKSLQELKPTDLKDNDSYDKYLLKDFNKNEALLIWVGKADDVASNYSITLLSGDNKHGHSYIGETISIKEPQDPVAMYQRSECCTLRGVAANRILDDKGRILVLVTILK